MSEVLPEVVDLVAEVAGVPPAEISAASRFDGLDAWGSFAALRLLAGVEDRFGVRLNLRDYLAIEHVGGLVDAVAGQAVP
jgi:acyl carrier protein